MIYRTSIGERRHPIQILQPTAGVGAWNNPESAWTVFAWVRAALKSHSGREFWRAQQRQSEVTEIFNIRYRAGITRRMRLVHAGQAYEIIDVDDLGGRHIEIDLLCKGLI